MNLSEIRKLVKLVESSEIQEVEIEREGTRIRISKGDAKQTALSPPLMLPYPQPQFYPPPLPIPGALPQTIPQPPAAPEIPVSHHEIKSPMVGTFYAAPAPDAAPYVKLGDTVKIGQVLCIVEAMKLMNEIESDVAGRIVKILVENSKPVEFGQVMFLIDTNL